MYPETMPKNAWYVAAHSDEVGNTLLSRTIFDTSVLLYRTGAGKVAALRNECIHRQLPLSFGCLQGDNIRCGYHGLVFSPEGRCVEIPNQENIPDSAKVQAYPVVEKDKLIWIWMGDAAMADASTVADCSWLASDKWTSAKGVLHLNSRAHLLNENLLDLSHLEFLHPGSIGASNISAFPTTMDFDDTSVRVTRIMDDIECPGLFRKAMGLPERIRRTQVAEWFAPCFHITHVSAAPLGAQGNDGLHNHKVIHCVTPETGTTAHYFWAVCRDYELDDVGLTDLLRDGHYAVFRQDVDACEAIEAVIQSYQPLSPPHVNIKVDSGPMRARRMIERMLEREIP